MNISGNNINLLRQNTIQMSKMEKVLEKVSSGVKINRAGDNACGLAISQKMNAQIRGLEQAGRNIQNGISMLQSADGGMNEIQNILQRVRELSVQASNGIHSIDDRNAMEAEKKKLLDNINKIAEYTEFNNIKLLYGEPEKVKVEESLKGEMPSFVGVPPTGAFSIVDYVKTELDPDTGLTTSVTEKYSAGRIDFSLVDSTNIKDLVGTGFFSTCCTCTKKYSIKFVEGKTNSQAGINPIIEIDISGITNGTELVDKIVKDSGRFMDHFTKMVVDPSDSSKLVVYDNRKDQKPNVDNDRGLLKAGVVYTSTTVTGGNEVIRIQAGANRDQVIDFRLPVMTVENLGLDLITLVDNTSAGQSLEKVDKAISYVTSERSRLGSYQNRFECAVNNVDNMSGNLANAKSRITDTDKDMAKVMAKYSMYSIPFQTSQSLLAQVNENARSILNLLR